MDIDSKQIQEVTKEGVVYVDDDGNQQFIDFLDCFNEYLKWASSAPVTTKWMAEMARQSKQVGEINYLGDIDPYGVGNADVSRPYVLFYDEQVTRFEFKDQDECSVFHQKVIDAGWRLFDLSD